MTTESWRTLKAGERVVVTAVGPNDQAFKGKVGTFIEYTKPHGFARLHLDGDQPTMRVLVHPESLDLES